MEGSVERGSEKGEGRGGIYLILPRGTIEPRQALADVPVVDEAVDDGCKHRVLPGGLIQLQGQQCEPGIIRSTLPQDHGVRRVQREALGAPAAPLAEACLLPLDLAGGRVAPTERALR